MLVAGGLVLPVLIWQLHGATWALCNVICTQLASSYRIGEAIGECGSTSIHVAGNILITPAFGLATGTEVPALFNIL